MFGFIEPGPNVNVSCSKFHAPFPRAKARHTGPGAPASAFGTPNAMLAHPVRDVRFLWAKPFREPTLRPLPLYDTRGLQPGSRPRSVPKDLLLQSCFLPTGVLEE